MLVIRKDGSSVNLEGFFELKVMKATKRKLVKKEMRFDLSVLVGSPEIRGLTYLTIASYDTEEEADLVHKKLTNGLKSKSLFYEV